MYIPTYRAQNDPRADRHGCQRLIYNKPAMSTDYNSPKLH